jgi:hypothetical protein
MGCARLDELDAETLVGTRGDALAKPPTPNVHVGSFDGELTEIRRPDDDLS